MLAAFRGTDVNQTPGRACAAETTATQTAMTTEKRARQRMGLMLHRMAQLEPAFEVGLPIEGALLRLGDELRRHRSGTRE